MKWSKVFKALVTWAPRVIRVVRGAKNERDAAKRGDTLRK